MNLISSNSNLQVSAATLERQFELEDIFDYIKTGIASVIEDEVTQRFVAEELKVGHSATQSVGLRTKE